MPLETSLDLGVIMPKIGEMQQVVHKGRLDNGYPATACQHDLGRKNG